MSNIIPAAHDHWLMMVPRHTNSRMVYLQLLESPNYEILAEDEQFIPILGWQLQEPHEHKSKSARLHRFKSDNSPYLKPLTASPLDFNGFQPFVLYPDGTVRTCHYYLDDYVRHGSYWPTLGAFVKELREGTEHTERMEKKMGIKDDKHGKFGVVLVA